MYGSLTGVAVWFLRGIYLKINYLLRLFKINKKTRKKNILNDRHIEKVDQIRHLGCRAAVSCRDSIGFNLNTDKCTNEIA
jgi:hypothetical protein